MKPKISVRISVEVQGTVEQHAATLKQIDSLGCRHAVNVSWRQYPGSVVVMFAPASDTGAAIAAIGDLVEGLTAAITGKDNWLGVTSGMAHFHAQTAATHLRALGLKSPIPL